MANNKISLFFKSLLLGIFISGFGVNGHAATLPAGYTELEYIESSGTQYIDTGYKLSSADEVKVKAKFISFSGSGSSYIFGIYGDDANFGVNGNSGASYAVWGSSSTQFTPSMVSGTVYDIDMKLGLLTINGIAASYTPSGTFTNTTKNVYLFWANGTTQPKRPVAIYSFQIINNGTIIQNLVPAKNSSGVIGMYDTVGNRFYTNAGTGTFTAGEYPSTCNANTTNLANMSASNVVIGQYISSAGDVVDNEHNFYNQEFIPVQPNKTYTLGFDTKLNFVSISEYDENQTFIKRNAETTGSNTSFTITTGATTKYIRFGSNMYGNQNTVTRAQVNSVNWMLTETSTAQPYVPYSVCAVSCPNGGTLQTYTSATGTVTQNGTPTPTNPIEPVFYKQGDMVLRKVGDIADSYDATTGKITRRVGVKVLNGTENWKAAGTSNVYYVGISDVARREKTALPSTHYVGSVDTNADMADNTVKQTSTSSITDMGTINVKQTSVGDLNGFKTFLAQQYDNGTPVKVYYVLATETTEDWAAEQCTSSSSPIKIATTAYNSARFSPVVTELNNTIATIRSVVTNTINQTKAIADLQAKKQTRPDEQCPAGKKCLLVEDNDGQPHWYEIIENAYGLPSGYTALEYIQSTGTQYIDTGLKLNQNNIVEVRYSYHTESDISTSGRIFGARYTSGSRNSFSIGSNTGKASTTTPAFAQFGDDSALALNNIVIGQWDTYKVSADGFYINDIKQGDFGGSTFETPFTVKLFAFEQASSSSGTPSIGGGVGRCKQFKVWNGDTLVMDLIPAKNSSNVVGMYDLVSGQFLTNQGTGTFTAGPEI